jgi:hypothetical protein
VSRLLDQFAADTAALLDDTAGLAEEITVTPATGSPVTVRGWWRTADPAESGGILGTTIEQTATAWVRVSDLPAPSYEAAYALASLPAEEYSLADRQRDTAGGLWKLLLRRRDVIAAGQSTAGAGA